VVRRNVHVVASVLVSAVAAGAGCNAIVGNSDHELELNGADARMSGDGAGREVASTGGEVGSEGGPSDAAAGGDSTAPGDVLTPGDSLADTLGCP
jgi:hypothetical protein